MHQWGKSNGPFTQPIGDNGNSRMLPASPAMSDLLATLGSAQRGLLVVAELTTAEDVTAALTVSKVLGWPLVADALSGRLLFLWSANFCCRKRPPEVLCSRDHIQPAGEISLHDCFAEQLQSGTPFRVAPPGRGNLTSVCSFEVGYWWLQGYGLA